MKNSMAAASAMALALSSGFALADGMKDPAEARKACEKQGKAGSPDELKKCCDNQILVEKLAEQKKLVQQCVQGKAGRNAEKK